MNVEIIKRILSKKKTALPSLRNKDCKTVKAENGRINKSLTQFTTNNTSELNELIYAGVKLVCAKNGVPRKNMDINLKSELEIRLEIHIRNLQKQAKILKQKKMQKYVGTKLSRKLIQSYWRNERKFPPAKLGVHENINNWMTRKQNNFGAK